MIKENFKLACRGLAKEKLNSFFTFLILVIGVSSFLCISLITIRAYNFDHFLSDYEFVYRVTTKYQKNDQYVKWAITNGYLEEILEDEIPEVKVATLILPIYSSTVATTESGKNILLKGESGFLVDENFLEVLSFPLIDGVASEVLINRNSIVVTQAFALKFFESEDVLGKSLNIESYGELTISGVLENIPGNSHLQFDFLISGKSSPSWYELSDPNEGGYMVHVYFKTYGQISVDHVQNQIDAATKGVFSSMTNMHFPIQALSDIHFHADNLFEIAKKGNESLTQILFGVGCIFLFLALTNFSIMSTVKAVLRRKDVRIRRSLGAGVLSLSMRIIIENIILSIVSSLVAIVLAQVLIENISMFFEGASISVFDDPWLLLLIMILAVLVGTIAGIYTIFSVGLSDASSTIEERVYKNNNNFFTPKNLLLTFQFSLVGFVLCGSLMVFKQLDFMENHDLGYNKERLINIHNSKGVDEQSFDAFVELLKGESSISSVSTTYHKAIGDYDATEITIKADGDSISIRTQWNVVDAGFISTMKMQLAQGRNFSESFATDSSVLIINEAAMNKLGLTDAVGVPYVNNSLGMKGVIVGVIKDWHFQSFDQAVHPAILFKHLHIYGKRNLLVKFDKSSSVKSNLDLLNSKWEEARIDVPIAAAFVDDWFNDLVKNEIAISNVLTYFTYILIMMSIIGIIAVVMYYIEEHKVEYGIRKVFGAGSNDILSLILRHYLLILVLALVIVIPIIDFGINSWLDHYLYHTTISFWEYFFTIVILFVIVTITIFFTSFPYSRKNPIDIIRQV